MKIQVIALWPITGGSKESVFSEPEIVFDQTVLNTPIRAIIQRDEESFFAEYDFPVSDSLRQNLEVTANGNDEKLTKDQLTDFDDATRPGNRFLFQIHDLLKYHLNISNITADLHIKHTIFRLPDNKPVAVTPRLQYVGRALNYESLNEKSAQLIRKCIADDFKPFLAMRHLHRAHDEREPRHKWIDATIAAELAIKEFLIRKQPVFKKLLLEVPSPPLSKLYGSILEDVVGETSPKRKELVKGSEKRNRLIHRPEEESVGHQEASDYCDDVEVAIYHLLTHLISDDYVADKICNYRGVIGIGSPK